MAPCLPATTSYSGLGCDGDQNLIQPLTTQDTLLHGISDRTGSIIGGYSNKSANLSVFKFAQNRNPSNLVIIFGQPHYLIGISNYSEASALTYLTH